MRVPAVLAISVALAGCFGESQSVEPAAPEPVAGASIALPGVLVAQDPRGDAAAYGAQTARALMHPTKCGPVPGPARPACWEALGLLRDAYPAPGGDGAVYEPALDVLGVSMREEAEALVVDITVAALDELAPSVVASDGAYTGGWRACWTAQVEGEETWECAYLSGTMTPAGVVLDGSFERDTLACNSWAWCAWQVPYTILEGAPATVRITIPRAILGTGDEGATLAGVLAGSWRSHHPGNGRADQATVSLQAGDAYEDSLKVRNWYYYPTDETMETGAFTFQAPMAPPEPSGDGFRFEDGGGNAAGEETDILEAALVETPSSLTVAVRVALVADFPEDHEFYVSAGMPNGAVPMAGYRAEGGRVTAWGEGCGDATCERWTALPVELARVAGAPGWVNITFPRWGLGSPGRESLANTVIIGFSYGAGHGVVPAGAGLALTLTDDSDEALAPPFWFRFDTA